MKSALKTAALFTLSLTLFGARQASAQSNVPPPGTFQHVIIVIQENRSPDNLFSGIPVLQGSGPWFEPGVDLALPPSQPPAQGQPPVPVPWCLGACFDPGHGNDAWQSQYGQGVYNSCPKGQEVSTTYCGTASCNGKKGTTLPACPQDTYVAYTDIDSSGQVQPVLLPYASIALQYGFANYFYQTNQGPSQPAHDFLFGGTSAPSGSSASGGFGYGQYYNEFAAANPANKSQGPKYTGCDYTPQSVPMIMPNGVIDTNFTPAPCFDHQTLADLLTSNGWTWKYYTNDLYDIWTAPSGIAHLCAGPDWIPSDFPEQCPYSEFTGNVVTPPNAIFNDVPLTTTGYATRCNLPNVTWVIPNGYWSDHPGFGGNNQYSYQYEYGPDWVASVINGVGSATCIDEIGDTPWQDTVILVVWDDWGGFYDHIGAEGELLPGELAKLYTQLYGLVLGLRLYLRVPGAVSGSLSVHSCRLCLRCLRNPKHATMRPTEQRAPVPA